MESIQEDKATIAAPATTMTTTQERPELSKDLSEVSKHYDIGSKGFLTPAEKAARELDFHDEGRLPNDQTVALIERTEDLKKANQNLRLWLIGLLGVTVALGLSQIATAIAAARLAKDTDVNESTGQLVVKGSGTAVVVVATGRTIVIDQDAEDGSICLTRNDVVSLFANTIQGSPSSAVLRTHSDDEDTDNMRAVQWTPSGTNYNSTRACISTTDGAQFCFDFGPCKNHADNGDPSRRLAAQTSQRKLFHQDMRRKLQLQGDPETVGDVGGDGAGVPGFPGAGPGSGQENPGYGGENVPP